MAAVTFADICNADSVRAGVRVVGALPSTTTACCASSDCIPALCNRLNILVVGQQPYTKFAGADLALTPPINGQPSEVITSGLPWSPVLSGRPGATLTTGPRADVIRQAYYPEYGPIIQNATILTYSMVSGAPVPGTTYKEATGTIAAYPRAESAYAVTAVPSAILSFVFRWCAPFTSACTGNVLAILPFEVLSSDSGPSKGQMTTSVRFLYEGWRSVSAVPGSEDPRCAETCVLLFLEQACPPVPTCLTPCVGAQPYMGPAVSDVQYSGTLAVGEVVTITAVYSAFSGVSNIRGQMVNPPPEFATVVVQPIPDSLAVKLTFMVLLEEGFTTLLTFNLLGDIVSPPCLHSSIATFVETGITFDFNV
jgi:hypothetical protein